MTLKRLAGGLGYGLAGVIFVALAACVPTKSAPVAPEPAPAPVEAPSVPEVKKAPLGEVLFRKEFPDGYVASTIIEPRRGERRGVSTLRFGLSPKADFYLGQGSIVLSLERLEVPEGFPTPEFDTLFSLLDRKGRQVLTAYATYRASERHAGEYPEGVTFYSDTGAKSVWGMWIPFDRPIEIGQNYELRFVWGPGGNWVFLDGEPLKIVFMDFSGQEYRKDGGAPFAPLLKDVRLLQVGTDAFPRDNSPLDSSRLKSLAIYSR